MIHKSIADSTNAAIGRRSGLRRVSKLLLLCSLLLVQLFVAVRFFTMPDVFNDPALTWTLPLRNRQTGFGSLLLGILIALAIIRPRLDRHWPAFVEAATAQRGFLPLLVQCSACLACYALAWPLYNHPNDVGVWGWPLLLGWGAGVVVCGAASLWLLAPLHYWRSLLALEQGALTIAGFGVIGSGILISLIYRAWSAVPLLASLTLNASAGLLGQFYPDVQVDSATAVLGVGGFAVQVSDVCSGYLGVSLTLGFLACYCYVFRDELRPWVMLALLPLGIALSLALNIVRIVLLVMLGVEVSPEVAVNGFHTNAGSIAMVLSCVVLVGLVHRFAVLRPAADAAPVQRLGWTLDFESALLVPMLVLLAATLLTGAFSATFVWLYPLRVIAVGLALAWCWKHLRILILPLSWTPVAIGIAVFGLWLAMIEADSEVSGAFGNVLNSAGPGLALAWLAMRTLGAVVTVPIAEELAFRGYLLAALSRQPVAAGLRLPFHWLGFVGSSLLFGALHGQWLAGTVAGMAYAWARYRRGRLGDAVVAHMTTNLLLALYVLITRQWSYW